MQDTLARLLADLRSSIATVKRLPFDDLAGLVAARLLIAVEEARVTLTWARDAALAARPADAKTEPQYLR